MKPSKTLKTMAKAALAAILVLLMGTMLLPAVVGATPAAAGPDTWAYGGQRVINGSGSYTGPNGVTIEYSYHAYYGWAVIYNQTNTSASTFEIQGTRATAADVFLNFCVPSCTSPRHDVNLTAVGWEKDGAFANFTENGTVYLNGVTPTSAVALENEQSTSVANLTASRTSSSDPSTNGYASVALSASGSVALAPPLGLFPNNVQSGETWNSTSNYSGQDVWQWNYHIQTPSGGSHTGTVSGNVSRSGTISLQGSDLGNTTLRGGVVVRQIGYQVIRGPFRFADGWFMLPLEADLFGGGAASWQGSFGANGAQLSTGAVDVAPGQGHMGMIAASSSFTPQAASPTIGSDSVSPAMQAGTLASSAQGYPTSAVQAQPMSSSQAYGLESALTTPYSAPGSSSSGGPLGHLGLIAVIAGVVVVAVVVVAYLGMGSPSRPKRPSSTISTRYREAASKDDGTSVPASTPPEAASEGGKDPLAYLR